MISPDDPGSPCSECECYCGVDEYEWKGKTICADCLVKLEDEGVIVGMCVVCGTLIDSDMELYRDRDKMLVCERCYHKYDEDGGQDR